MLAPLQKPVSINLDDWHFNIQSSKQMQEFLYEFLGLEPLKEANSKGNFSTDEQTITYYAENMGVKFCALLIAYRKLSKAKNTYLADIFRNIDYDFFFLHPEFWLNTAETYRSSSTSPNFQNIPKHGQIIAEIAWKIIRKLFVAKYPHSKWLLAEVDYDGAETKVAGMLGNDQQMIDDLNNDLDMHSHWAIELFGLKGLSYKEVKEKYDETYRFLAKNNFTFANFFGAGNTSIAEEFRKSEFYKEYVNGFWIQNPNRQGTFENYFIEFSEDHIAKCQNAFYDRYRIYKAWQDNLVKLYYRTGFVENPFGFRRRYPLKRNEIINYPIQSTSFLLLLDSIIRIEEAMEKNNMESHLIGQIHDSGMANVVKWEAYDFIELCDEMMTHKPHLPWTQKVKMKTDWSFGKNWLDMFRVNQYKYVN